MENVHSTLLLIADKNRVGSSALTRWSIWTYCAAMKKTIKVANSVDLEGPELAERRPPTAGQQREAQDQHREQQAVEHDGQRFGVEQA